MAGLQQLKNRLRSIKITAQIADAMKTVSSAKLSKLTQKNKYYAEYTAALAKLSAACGVVGENSHANTRPCFLVLGSNRGLNGSFNSELHSFAEKTLRQQNGAVVYVCGKSAESFFCEKEIPFRYSFTFNDIPSIEDYEPLFSALIAKYLSGEITSINVIYSKYINTLKQIPEVLRVLPSEAEESAAAENEPLFFPEKQAICKRVDELLIKSRLYSCALSTATGSQAATLMAMRTASDNAAQAVLSLTTEINKKRQNRVTADVIETGSGLKGDEDAWKM